MLSPLNDPCFKLTNDDVNRALPGYDCSRAEILDYLLAEEVFKGDTAPAGPFGFDLGRIEPVRQAIKHIVAPRHAHHAGRDSQLTPFRRELIFATADATRRDAEQLVLHLYLALMECHAALPPSEPSEPRKATDPSAAGTYLLKCLLVQAAYDNLATYRFVLEQFARVVAAIKLVDDADQYAHMLGRLVLNMPKTILAIQSDLNMRTGPPPPTATSPVRLHVVFVDESDNELTDDYANTEKLRIARQKGASVVTAVGAKPPCVVLLKGDSDGYIWSEMNVTERGAVDAGGRVVRVFVNPDTKAKPDWSSSGQVLRLSLPTKAAEDLLAACDTLPGAPVPGAPPLDWTSIDLALASQDKDMVALRDALHLFLAVPE